ncbi:MAG: transcription termination factor NusA [Acidobacteriota bacterium]
MATSLNQTIEILSKEKNIDPHVIISAIEDAVMSAARKQFKTGEELRARFNDETGEVDLFALMTVVEEVTNPATEISLADVEEMGVEGAEVGDQLEFPKPTESLGRIAAQTAKQILVQKVREAERNNVYDEYIERVGELVHGFVKRFEGGRIIVDFGKIEAVLPKDQQSRAENFNQGERIRVVISNVSKDSKGPQVEVSRTSPELLKRLFEMEVPEIYDGTVQIKAAVREAGDRAKIAVVSTERDVDPVGACVGMKGSRVQAIIRELRGERIDIIEWSEDPAIFAANALSPAKVSKVEINSFEDKHLTVTVSDDQLSLAIGKRGQNVRLAAKLVGWHIDIRSAEEAARMAAAQLEAVMSGGEANLLEIRESLALDQITTERLHERGIETIEDLANLSVDDLVEIIDLSFDQATEVIERANRLLAQKHAREVKAANDADEVAAEAQATDEVEETATATQATDEEEVPTGESDEATESGATEPVTAGAETVAAGDEVAEAAERAVATSESEATSQQADANSDDEITQPIEESDEAEVEPTVETSADGTESLESAAQEATQEAATDTDAEPAISATPTEATAGETDTENATHTEDAETHKSSE